MADHLVVIAPFGDRAVGDVIADAEAVERALATNPTSVVRIAAPATPAEEG